MPGTPASSTTARPRNFPRGGTYLETENGTIIWSRNLEQLTAGCRQVCAGSSMSAPAATNSSPAPQPSHQKKPVSAAQRKALAQARERKAQLKRQQQVKAQKPRAMAAGSQGS